MILVHLELCEDVFSLWLVMSNVTTDTFVWSVIELLYNNCKLTLLHQSLLERSDEIVSLINVSLMNDTCALRAEPSVGTALKVRLCNI
jgi:hypothetical protein